jgi:serine/threonine protein kinase
MGLNPTVDPAILKRFEVGEKIGEGSYGIVWKAVDKKSQTTIALKKQVDAFRNRKDAQRTMREILTLRKLYGRSKNIIGLQEVLKGSDLRDVYLVMDCMEGDLSKLPGQVQLNEQEHARIMYQILAGLHCMHSHECLHRDIKPSNILCNSRGDIVKLGDLGLARTLESLEAEAENEDPEDIRNSTGSLWYMAPEALLGSHVVSKPSDVWAVGCVMGEMLGLQPLFGGSSKHEVLARITQLVGKPDQVSALSFRTLPSHFLCLFTQFSLRLLRTACSTSDGFRRAMALRRLCRTASLQCRDIASTQASTLNRHSAAWLYLCPDVCRAADEHHPLATCTLPRLSS